MEGHIIAAAVDVDTPSACHRAKARLAPAATRTRKDITIDIVTQHKEVRTLFNIYESETSMHMFSIDVYS